MLNSYLVGALVYIGININQAIVLGPLTGEMIDTDYLYLVAHVSRWNTLGMNLEQMAEFRWLDKYEANAILQWCL